MKECLLCRVSMVDATEVWALYELFLESAQYSWCLLPQETAKKGKWLTNNSTQFKQQPFRHDNNSLHNPCRKSFQGTESQFRRYEELTSAWCGGWDLSALPACLWISATLAAVRLASCLQSTRSNLISNMWIYQYSSFEVDHIIHFKYPHMEIEMSHL